MRPLQVDSIHHHVGVTNYEAEMAGNYINLYDADLIDIYLSGEKGVAAERDEIRGFHANINPAGICQPGYFQPPDLPEVPHNHVAAIFRECAGRWAAISDDTSDMCPTQMAAYNFVTSWAENAGFLDKTHGEPPIPLRFTLLGTVWAGKTRVISEIAQRYRDTFGSRQSVVAAAHTGVDASNVGCGGRTLACLFRTIGATIDELKGGELRELKSELEECRILVMGEISTVGPQQLDAVSERLMQCTGLAPAFGGVGVVFSGDFAHLPPIGKGRSYTMQNPARAAVGRNLLPRRA